jgi:hypothetical protein
MQKQALGALWIILDCRPQHSHDASVRKRVRIVLMVVLIGGVGVVGLELGRRKEPSYEGKSLSVWLNDYRIMSPGMSGIRIQGQGHSLGAVVKKRSNPEVNEAVRQMGINAIPTLFRMMNAKDPPLRALASLADDHGVHVLKYFPIPALEQQMEAACAFHALGADAKTTVPKLIEMYDQRRHDPAQELVAVALGGIGPPAGKAVPSLLRAVTNNALFWSRYDSLSALGEIHAEPEKVVPVLIQLIKDPDVSVRMRSILDLEAFGVGARSAVPALLESLAYNEKLIRKAATNALNAIDPAAVAKAGMP